MNDLEAIYEDILDKPNEDFPRLAYAEKLEETAGQMTCPECRGDPYNVPWFGHGAKCHRCNGAGAVDNGHTARAEFIRAQMELAREESAIRPSLLGAGAATPQIRGLRAREEELWLTVGGHHHWGNVLPTVNRSLFEAGHGMTKPIALVRRGFVDEIRVTHDSFLDHLPALARHPITRVVLTDREPVQLRDGWHWPVGAHPRGVSWDIYYHMTGMPYATSSAALDALSAACCRLLAQTRAAAPAIPAPG